MNEVFDDVIDGQEGAGLSRHGSPRPLLSPDRREYLSLAAVPRLSRPSWDLQVPTAPPAAACSLSGCAWLHRWWCPCSQTVGGSHVVSMMGLPVN